MGNHEITIGDASVTFEQVEVDLDYSEILSNIEDTIAARISDQIGDEAWDAVKYLVGEALSEHEQEYDHASQGEEGLESQVYELLLDYKNGVTSCAVGKAFEEAVWKAMCRLDNPDTHDSVWAAAAKEYLLSVTPQTPRSQDVRAIVREELFNLGRLGQLRLTVYPPVFGADIAVAPGD